MEQRQINKNEAKSIIAAGDIVFIDVTPYRNTVKGFLQNAIKYFTGAKYHHAGIVAKKNGSLIIIESVFNGFLVTRTVNEFIDRANVVYDLSIIRTSKPEDWNTRLAMAEGNPYDFGSLVIFQVLYQITRRLGKGIWFGKRGIKALNRLYCTEAVAFIVGLDKWWTYDPKKLYDTLKFKEGIEYIL